MCFEVFAWSMAGWDGCAGLGSAVSHGLVIVMKGRRYAGQ